MTPEAVRGAALAAPRRVGVVVRNRHPDLPDAMARMMRVCREREVVLRFNRADLDVAPPDAAPLHLDDEEVDLVVSLGGDGTLLRAARLVGGRGIPLFGINLGQLGFLTTTGEDDLEEGLGQVLDGQGVVESRFTLRAQVHVGDVPQSGPLYALNDVVVHKPGAARVTPIRLSVGEGEQRDLIGSFSADGVILATPTGSTAYSMSAGGPIIVPEVECILVTTICPHSLAVRPLAVPSREAITIRPLDPEHGLNLSVDGRVDRALGPGDSVVVRRGDVDVNLVRLPGQTFFGTLRRKLNWAARPPERA